MLGGGTKKVSDWTVQRKAVIFGVLLISTFLCGGATAWALSDRAIPTPLQPPNITPPVTHAPPRPPQPTVNFSYPPYPPYPSGPPRNPVTPAPPRPPHPTADFSCATNNDMNVCFFLREFYYSTRLDVQCSTRGCGFWSSAASGIPSDYWFRFRFRFRWPIRLLWNKLQSTGRIGSIRSNTPGLWGFSTSWHPS